MRNRIAGIVKYLVPRATEFERSAAMGAESGFSGIPVTFISNSPISDTRGRVRAAGLIRRDNQSGTD